MEKLRDVRKLSEYTLNYLKDDWDKFETILDEIWIHWENFLINMRDIWDLYGRGLKEMRVIWNYRPILIYNKTTFL